MGANSSSILSESDAPLDSLRPSNLGDVPESCVAVILSYLDPPEICLLARVNKAFWAASSADFIWDSRLPSNYRYILCKLRAENDHLLHDLGKKEIFARISRPIPFDGGTKEVWLDKVTGGVCLSISSKALTITGIDDRRYWNHIPTDESRFQTVAYLQQIWWVEVDGELEFQFPADTYSLFFRLQLGKVTKRLGRRVCYSENVHGWDIKPVQFQLTTLDGQRAVSRVSLDNVGNWMCHHVGDFVVHDPSALTRVMFSLTQIDCTHTKGGLCVDSVLICPIRLAKEVRSSF